MFRVAAPVAMVLALAIAPAVVPQFYVTLLNYIGLFSMVALLVVTRSSPVPTVTWWLS